MNLCPFSFSWNWKYEVRMSPRTRLDPVIGGPGNDGAKRLRISGVAKTPYVFYLFLRKLKRLGDIDVGGEEFYAWRVRGLVGGMGLGGGIWYRLFRNLRWRRRRRREARRCS